MTPSFLQDCRWIDKEYSILSVEARNKLKALLITHRGDAYNTGYKTGYEDAKAGNPNMRP